MYLDLVQLSKSLLVYITGLEIQSVLPSLVICLSSYLLVVRLNEDLVFGDVSLLIIAWCSILLLI